MKEKLNIIGVKYGKLTVIEEIYKNDKYRRYNCLCDCGNYSIVWQSSLRSGNTESCGCIRKENTRKMFSSGQNEIVYHKDFAEVIMVDNKGVEKARAVIDLEDVELIREFRWWITPKGYAVANINGEDKTIHMHKLIHPNDVQADHKDRNKLNNRRLNLRDATNQQNTMNQGIRSNNTSGTKGVCWNGNSKRWISELMKEGIKYRLGSFVNKEDAIKARRECELKYFGEFAPVGNVASG